MRSIFSAHDGKFEIFCEELMQWNKTHNLSAYKRREQIYENIVDSIYPLEFICDFQNALDIGSGGGFPAILLSILKEDSRFTLLEPNAKKAAFLRVVALKLELKNIEIHKERLEIFGKNCEKKFDLITSRALFDAQKLINLSANLLSENGYFLFYKGKNLLQERLNGALIQKNDCIIRNQRLYFYKSKKEVCCG